MERYPKIETLFNRDKATFKVDTSAIRLPEFSVINNWHVTEKLHGMNLRVGLDNGKVTIAGRSDNAQFKPHWLEQLQATFTLEKMTEVFTGGPVVVFGELYGEGIQKGGGNYRSGQAVRIFDVRIGNWWLDWKNVEAIAAALGIETVPSLGVMPTGAIITIVQNGLKSVTARLENDRDVVGEGIVAKSSPLMLMRDGERFVGWKLKVEDF